MALIKNSEPSFDYDPDKILLSVTADGTASKYLSQVSVFWASTNELHIKYPLGDPIYGPRLARTNSPDRTIKVVYESFNVK